LRDLNAFYLAQMEYLRQFFMQGSLFVDITVYEQGIGGKIDDYGIKKIKKAIEIFL
jgi:hypothetical protein